MLSSLRTGASSDCCDSLQVPGPLFSKLQFPLVLQHLDLQMRFRESRKPKIIK